MPGRNGRPYHAPRWLRIRESIVFLDRGRTIPLRASWGREPERTGAFGKDFTTRTCAVSTAQGLISAMRASAGRTCAGGQPAGAS